ncbi:MAG: restriction endonuclease subunit S [Treponema sp.]|nr:restriction endonuclease subunit S [Treponema sp.]
MGIFSQQTIFNIHKRHYEQFADGTIKDIEDEIPFDVPEGWAWCRFGELFYHTTGKALKKSNNKGSLRKYITTSNLYWNKFDFTEVREMYFTDDELDKCTIKKGDLVLCNGGDVGRAAIWNFDEDICYQNHVSRLRPKIIGINNKLYLYLLMFYKEQGMLNGKGVGITSLSANDLLSGLFPLPPINEQVQIVIKIENIFSQIDYIDENKSDLQTAIKQTKSKILDLAIHGKLVPQDQNDEPAEELLKRIATSDNRPYKKFEVEEPFDIPESWTWCTGNDLFNSMTSKKPEGETFKYIDIDAIDNKKHCVIEPKTLAVSEAPSRASRELNNGDVLFSLVRPYLENIALIEEKNSDCIASTGFYVCKPRSFVFSKFLFYLMTSEYVIKGLNQFMKGDNSPSISSDDIKNWLYPLPPLTEQLRIVSKIEELFKNMDEILQNLSI